jgi:xanthine dehydrogenase accessory factor
MRAMDIHTQISKLIHENKPFVLATIVNSEGSVPGKVGFKLLYEPDKKISGTVGGGALEQQVIVECQTRLKNNVSGSQEYLLSDRPTSGKINKDIPVIPMMCQGRVSIYYEVHQILPEVYIFGGGHVGQALSYFLARLNFRIILIDNRREFANSDQNPYAHQWIFTDYVKFSREFQPPANSFIVIITHGHQFDYDILKTIYQRKLSVNYIGVIASRSKVKQLRKQLLTDLGSQIDLSDLFSPIGIDLGGSTDSEIALSITAEIQAVLFHKTVPHLRESIQQKQ